MRRDRLGRELPEGVHVAFRRDVLAEVLWELGEDALAERALGLTEDELRAVQDLTLWHRTSDVDPPGGPRATNGRTMARGAIDLLEGGGRELARRRRRTRPVAQRSTAALESGATPPDTPAERGER